MGTSIRVDVSEPILTITIDRPEAMNALDPPAHGELSAIFDRFADDPKLWVAIITGAGDRAFSTGNDLKYLARTPPDQRIPFPKAGLGGLTARFNLNKPIIAAVNGVAMGGGFEPAISSSPWIRPSLRCPNLWSASPRRRGAFIVYRG
jgi:enoyl-CoA hydratase/carnithine racemase